MNLEDLSIHIQDLRDSVQFLRYVSMPQLNTLGVDFVKHAGAFTQDQFTGRSRRREPPEFPQLSHLSITCVDEPTQPIVGLDHLLTTTPNLQSLKLSHLDQWDLIVDAITSPPYPCPTLSLLELADNADALPHTNLSHHIDRLREYRGPESICPIECIRVVQSSRKAN